MLKNKYPYIILFSLFTGCVEHIFFIKIEPNGNYNINYQCNGNLDDLKNYDFPIPDLPNWEITSPIKKKNKSYFFSSNKNFNNNEITLDNFSSNDSVPYAARVKHPINIYKTNYLFFETITFKCSFKSRQAYYKYPTLTNWINDPDNRTENTIKEILKYIINQSIDDANLSFNIYPIIKNDVNKWYQNKISDLSDSIIFNNFENFITQGGNIIKSNLINKTTNIDSIINIYKMEADITMNLIDDDFNIKINIPNKIFSHNADTIINDTLIWKFSVNDFLNNDKELFTYSYKIIYLNMLIFLLSVLFLFIYKKTYFLDKYINIL